MHKLVDFMHLRNFSYKQLKIKNIMGNKSNGGLIVGLAGLIIATIGKVLNDKKGNNPSQQSQS